MRNARPAKAKPRARPSGAAPRVVRGDRIPRAYHQLRELIVSGRLAPGSRIIESDIAERLGVSRTPVRSALHRLQQEGYIAGIGRGNEPRLSVAPLTQDDARDLFAIIGAIEEIAAGGAEGARRAVQRNWRNAAARLSSVIRTLGERGSW